MSLNPTHDEIGAEQIREAMDLADKIKPLLGGVGAGVQGAVLAELLSIHIIQHAPALREVLIREHMKAVRKLMFVNEKILFGEGGHPTRLPDGDTPPGNL